MSGDMRVGMLFQANAKQAVAEVQSLRDAQSQLAKGAVAAGKAAAAMAPQIDNLGSVSRASAQQILEAVGSTAELASVQQIIRAAINPLVGEYNQLQQAIREIAIAEELGAISGREAALAMDMLTRQSTQIVTSMEAAGTAIDGSTIAAQRQDTVVQHLVNTLSGVARGTEETIADHLRHGQVLDDLRAKFDPLFAASRRYEIELHEIAEAEAQGAISATAAAAARQRAAAAMAPMPAQLQSVGASSQNAAFHVTQLGYQLNDIGMMMALGQSPFMLMMQQGPQVVQVFNGMRASGMAVGTALRSSLGLLINPMSLATMAAIGLGAALVQHLSDGTDAAVSLDDAISDLKRTTSDLEAAMKEARLGVFDLRKEFGDGALAAREMNIALLDLARIDALDKVTAAAEGLKAEFNGLLAQVDRYDQATRNAGGPLREDWLTLAQTAIRQIREEFGLTIIQATEVADAVRRMGDVSNIDGVIAGSRDLARVLSQARDESGNIPPELRATAKAAAEAAIEALRLKGYTEEAERIAQSFAATNMSAPITAAADEAARLLANMKSAAYFGGVLDTQGGASGLAEQYAQYGAGREATRDVLNQASPFYGGTGNILSTLNPNYYGGGGRVRDGGGGGGGGSSTQKDTNALKELIAAQEDQIATLRETDPVQREILKNHDALADATEAETQTVIDLIAERQRLEQVRDTVEEIGQAGEDAFKGLMSGAYDLGDALSMLLAKLADMAASSVWDMVWGAGDAGGGGLGSLLTGWLGGLGAKADGGKITGRGGPRDDAILTWMSNGEYAVNAAATAANEPLLEAINAGANPSQLLAVLIGSHAPKYADGGRIGASAPSNWRDLTMAANAPAASPGLVLNVINNSSAQVDARVEETTDARGQRQYQLVMSDAVATGLTASGGRAGRALRDRYGVKPAGRVR